MANIIKIKRGLSSNISNATLEQGELAIMTDTQDLYVGTDSGNKKVGGGPKNILDGNIVGSVRTVGSREESDSYKLGKHAFAEGENTKASGPASHAEGGGTTASGDYSHAEGFYTTASVEAQHVQGKYNISDTTSAHIVGNGSSDSNRSNVHTLDWQGNAWFAGDVYTGSTSGTNKDAGSKVLATKEYVDSKTSANYTYDKVVYVLPPSEVTTTTGKTAFTQDSEARTFTAVGAITGEDPVIYENVITLTADVKNILIYSLGSLIGDMGPADQIAQISITDASGTTSQILNTRGCSENLINTGPLTSGSKLTLTYTSGTYEPSNAQQVFTLEYYTNTVTDASLQDFISSKVTHESTNRRQMDIILQKIINAQYSDLQTQIFDLQGHVIENMLDAVTFRLSNLDNKSEFRFFGPSNSGVTHLGLSFEDVSLTSGDKFEMSATFQTASSGCTFEITESTSVKVKLTGDDVTNGVLNTVADKVYEIAFYWNGLFMSGVVNRHIYIKDPNIRPLKVGDALKNGTKLYFNIPDNITELYSEYKHTRSTKSKIRSKAPVLKASPSAPSTTDTLISKFLNVTYYPDDFELPLVTNLILTDGSSNIDIFKANLNQSIKYKPEINVSSYTITSPTTITDYNEFDFWSQFILVDETTL